MDGLLARRRPGPFAAALALSLLALQLAGPAAIYQSRSFYGSYRVVDRGDVRTFVHGTTIHGTQLEHGRSGTPTTYYSRTGPIGDAFSLPGRPAAVGVVGLGVGTMAAYVGAGQSVTFFEIDPEVAHVAEDPELFTFLSATEADVEIVLGDGRLRLGDAGSGTFDTLVLDAFTSDAIPVHLLTNEALRSTRTPWQRAASCWCTSATGSSTSSRSSPPTRTTWVGRPPWAPGRRHTSHVGGAVDGPEQAGRPAEAPRLAGAARGTTRLDRRLLVGAHRPALRCPRGSAVGELDHVAHDLGQLPRLGQDRTLPVGRRTVAEEPGHHTLHERRVARGVERGPHVVDERLHHLGR